MQSMTKLGSHHSIFTIKAQHMPRMSYAKKIFDPARRAQFLRQKHNLESTEEFLKKKPKNHKVADAIEMIVRHPSLGDHEKIFEALAIVSKEEPECKIFIHANLEKYYVQESACRCETSKNTTVKDGGELRDNLHRYNDSGVLIFNIPARHTHEKLNVQIGDVHIQHADPLYNLQNRGKSMFQSGNQHAYLYDLFSEKHALLVSGNGLFFSENPHDKKYKRTRKMQMRHAEEVVSEKRVISRLGEVKGNSPVKGFFMGFFSSYEY